ncbi:hypothetical protein SORBI_3008G193000 [Sorghum bicolor]|uniref:Uncharacterized protein n=1 Tax=Sorghum bicolor TaxID=4558 RepID=A0A1B6PEN2_SORBI|nr:hypothetical protein SORBI_3008G193000 [Sorghum bicolor]
MREAAICYHSGISSRRPPLFAGRAGPPLPTTGRQSRGGNRQTKRGRHRRSRGVGRRTESRRIAHPATGESTRAHPATDESAHVKKTRADARDHDHDHDLRTLKKPRDNRRGTQR